MTYSGKIFIGGDLVAGQRSIDVIGPATGMGRSGVDCDCSYLALNDYPTIKRISRAFAARGPYR